MNNLPISLNDLIPVRTSFKLSTMPDNTFTLEPFSLYVRLWAEKKYGPEKMQEAFQKMNMEVITDLTWFMLDAEDKAKFDNTAENLLKAATTTKDLVAIIKACLGSVGIGEPEIKKIDEALKKKSPPMTNPKNRKK